MSTNKLSISNFRFTPQGYGHYEVIYTTATGREYGCITTDMPLIDATKNSDDPKQTDLKQLARLCRCAAAIAKQCK